MIKYAYSPFCEPFATLTQKQSLWHGTVFACLIRERSNQAVTSGTGKRNKHCKYYKNPTAIVLRRGFIHKAPLPPSRGFWDCDAQFSQSPPSGDANEQPYNKL